MKRTNTASGNVERKAGENRGQKSAQQIKTKRKCNWETRQFENDDNGWVGGVQVATQKKNET